MPGTVASVVLGAAILIGCGSVLTIGGDDSIDPTPTSSNDPGADSAGDAAVPPSACRFDDSTSTFDTDCRFAP